MTCCTVIWRPPINDNVFLLARYPDAGRLDAAAPPPWQVAAAGAGVADDRGWRLSRGRWCVTCPAFPLVPTVLSGCGSRLTRYEHP